MITLQQLDNILSSAQRHPNDEQGCYLLAIARVYSLAIIAHRLTDLCDILLPLSIILDDITSSQPGIPPPDGKTRL